MIEQTLLGKKIYTPESKISLEVAESNSSNLQRKSKLILGRQIGKNLEIYWVKPGNLMQVHYDQQRVVLKGNLYLFPESIEVAEELLKTKLKWFREGMEVYKVD